MGPQFGPISLTVRARQVIVIQGESGAGKSVLLRALADLDPNQGVVYLNGQPRAQYSPTSWRKLVGLLPAESHWWSAKVGSHFAQAGDQYLAALGFDHAVLDWSVERLSSGERQRLALIRLVVNHPQILLLDEPTANLDPDNTRRVESLVLRYLAEHNAGAIWVSHDKEQVQRVASTVLRLDKGRLRAARS